MSTNNPIETRPEGRLVIESLDEPNVIPMFGWNEWDTFFALGSLTVGGMVGVFFNLQWYFVLGLALLTGGIGVALVNAAPPYANVREFWSLLVYYARHHNEVKNQAEAAVEANDSLVAQIQTPETTRERTNIKRFIPEYGLIERTTGEFQVMLRYYPPNADFAEPTELVDIVSSIEEWAMTDGEFDFDYWVTTESVEAEEYVTQLQDRRYDGTNSRTVVEQELLKEMATTEAHQIENSAEVAHYYFLIDVTVGQAADEYVGDKSSLQRAAETPIIGAFLKGFVETQEELTETEKYEQMLRVIDRRVDKMGKIAEGISGARVEKVPVQDYIKLQFDYWNGHTPEVPGPRTSPVVTVEEPEEADL